LLCLAGTLALGETGWVNVREHGVLGDGKTDDTQAVQKLLDAGKGGLVFPKGDYRLGSLRIGSGGKLRFGDQAIWHVLPGEAAAKAAELAGNDILIQGPRMELKELGKPAGKSKFHTLFHARKCTGLRLTGLVAKRPQEGKLPVWKHIGWKGQVTVLLAEECRDVEVDRCDVENIRSLVQTEFSENVSVHENRAEWCDHISLFRNGSRDVRHYANRSKNVIFQCMWWGGDANDKHKWITDNTANVVRPDLKPGDEGYDKSTVGVYNISVQNNMAEYGVTLAWGAKARNVVVTGNTAKFMEDMAYDSEGDENVVIANNISINSKCAGIGCYFWTDKVLITGNQLLTLDQGEKIYKGNFIRLHSSGRAGPDHFGTGKCLVRGNLMVSEVEGSRSLLIEACRDVTVSGNKFVNGRINTNPWDEAYRITISDNEFYFHNGEAVTPIEIVNKGVSGIVKGNVLTWECETLPETAATVPAILVRGTRNRDQIVAQNIVRGWLTAIQAQNATPTGSGPRFVLKDNTVDGDVIVPPTEPLCRVIQQGNLDLRSAE
jgi:hypothetical protein